MNRTSSLTQSTMPFTFESMPNEIHRMILNEIPGMNSPAGRPTLRSVSCVNQRLHAIAMPFLMECYVSTVEIAVPALSPEKKVDTLIQLKNWLRIHADQMPLIAYMDAMNRTKKLTDGLGPAELGLLLFGSQPFFALSNDAPHSVKDLIAMQMSLASYKSAVDKLAAHHLKITDDLKKFWQDS